MPKKTNSNAKDQIAFRGNKDKWIDFTYQVKKRKEKSIWTVLERLIDRYIKQGRK